MVEKEVEAVGSVKKNNNSLYVLIPIDIAQKLGIQKGYRWMLYSEELKRQRSEASLIYHFALPVPESQEATSQPGSQ